MGKLFELRVPFFIPLWRRIAVVGVCIVWALFELSSGAIFWSIFFFAIAAMAAWQFFLSGWPDKTDPGGKS